MRPDDPDLFRIARFWLRLALADLRLKVFPHSWNRDWIFGTRESHPASTARRDFGTPPSAEDISRLELLIARAASRPLFFDMSCLRRALVLRDYLRGHRGVEGKIVFGTRKDGPDGAAAFHAWLQTRGSDGSEPIYSKFN